MTVQNGELRVEALIESGQPVDVGVLSRWEVITPERAEMLLEHNVSNRMISRKTVMRYASDIERGDWKQVGQGISIDSNGNLEDGQHRLRAIAQAGMPVAMLVSYGVDPRSKPALDGGRKRTFGDDLRIAGIPQAIQTASAVKLISDSLDAYEQDVKLNRTRHGSKSRFYLEEMRQDYDARFPLLVAVRTSQRLSYHLGVIRSAGAAFCWLIAERYGEELLDAFTERLIHGDRLAGEAITACYEFLMKLQGQAERPSADLYLEVLLRGFVDDVIHHNPRSLYRRGDFTGRLPELPEA